MALREESPISVEEAVRKLSAAVTREIQDAAERAHNEAEFRTAVTRTIEKLADELDLSLSLREEYTLLDSGRADAVYNRFVIEYEPPGSLHTVNSYRTNEHAIGQVKQYIEGLHRVERHKMDRIAGVAFDGNYFIFVRFKDGSWEIDTPLLVTKESTERFIKYLYSLSTELALTASNLVRDFGEGKTAAKHCVSTLYTALTESQDSKIRVLFSQWKQQFAEVCGYESGSSRLDVKTLGRRFGVRQANPEAFPLFFAIHSYYATFIKLLAVQIASYYAFPRLGTGLMEVASYPSDKLASYLKDMEHGGVFKNFGISNFLEGDFFGWYLEVWDDGIEEAIRELISILANYSLVTLEVDQEQTRDLLKKLYQNLMPKDLRHNLGEYYTPDWIAERLLNQLESGKFEGNPDKRLLDPACGSGTFLVIAIQKIKEYGSENLIPEHILLEKILGNVVGYDLNPLAVISARTNYLLAVGDLLPYRKGEVSIPVYLADSIMTPSQGRDLFGQNKYSFKTAVGEFAIPKSLVSTRYIDDLANLLEESVEINRSPAQFRQSLLSRFPLVEDHDHQDLEILEELYNKMLELENSHINGIWARIIKNAFAPLFQGQFDYIAGNPPWVNWESLPDQYRDETKWLWEKYGLFTLKGWQARMGGGKKDISALMTYVAIDGYLKAGGKLGFVITQTVFKTTGGSEGFRRFRLGENDYLQVLHVDDMSAIKPFEGAANRTSVVIIKKGDETRYPIQYTYWRKKKKGTGIPEDMPLKIITEDYIRTSQWQATPVNSDNPYSPWITGRPRAIAAARKVIAASEYQAREGSNTGGLNGAYWVSIIAKRPDGSIVVRNEADIGKKHVENRQSPVEPDLLYPLLRGQDIQRWQAEPRLRIILAQNPETRVGWDEDWMKETLPKTYFYFKQFEEQLRQRSLYRKYCDSKDAFYSMYGVSAYTLADYKVTWTRVATDIKAAVVGSVDNNLIGRKPVIPADTATMVAFNEEIEAHYFAALMNSSPTRFVIASYSSQSTGSFGSPHVLTHVKIPKYNRDNEIHTQLASLSKEAHQATAAGEPSKLKEIEESIDQAAARLWELTPEELRDIQNSLRDLTI
ncbi:MAG: N-6 DNA methylase [Dehalococcoidales bacterium]|nr:N-6 DNA methylase [Dehalococcoidales bacterium]